MAQIHDNIEALFGAAVTEADIIEAFRVEHPGFTAHPMASARENGIFIHGDFNTSTSDCRFAGQFERYIYRDGVGVLAAHHQYLVIEREFRQQDLAKSHFAKLIRFYEKHGIEYVHLEAACDGPIVWPQFGFELREPSDVERLHAHFRSVLAELGYEAEPPARLPSLALMPPIEGIKVGFLALSRLYEELGFRPIPMLLDLKDKGTRVFLADQGIL